MDIFAPVGSATDIARVIQLAITPVFTVAAISGLLSVLSTRLARVIDRARLVEARIPLAKSDAQRDLLCEEASFQWLRIRAIHRAIQLSVAGALMICLVIVALFVEQFVAVSLSTLIAVLFVLAMVSVIVGLLFLLFEIGYATRRMRQGIEAAVQGVGEFNTDSPER